MKKLIIILLLIPYQLFAHHYYVKTAGNNSNTGLSDAQAWATISKVNGFTFAAGDTISFNKGDTWRELLTIPRSGTSGSYMLFNSYGTGNNPRIAGSNISAGWTNYSGNVWVSTTTFTDPFGGTYDAQVFFESGGTVTWGAHKTSIAACVAEYDWTWSGNYVYVYAATDPGTRYTSVEIPQRTNIIGLASRNYLHFDGIDIFYSIQAGYAFGGWPQASQTGLIIENSKIGYIGIKNSEYAYGIDAGYSDMIVRGCDISNCGRRGISFHLYGMGWTQTNVLVEDNYFHDGWHTTGPDLSVGSSGYYTASINGMTIRRNRFYDPPTTNAFSEFIFIQNSNGGVAGAKVKNIYIYSNVFENSSNGGIHMETSDSIYIYNNTFHNHNTSSPSNTFHINISKVSPGYCTHTTIKNNIFYSTGTYSSSGNECIFVKSGAITGYSDVICDYNIYYRTSSSRRVIEFESIHSYIMSEIALLRTNTGWETHGNFIDPLLVSSTDYHLQTGSPAIAAGIGVGIALDYYKNSYAASPSIGAIEYDTEASTATDILTFTVPSQVGSSTVNSTNHTVVFNMEYGTDVTALIPTITVSTGATIDPASLEATNFTSPVAYTVTAQDAITEQEWTVTCNITEASTNTDIQSFVFAEQTGAATISTITHTVTAEVVYGTNLNGLYPTVITLYEDATIAPPSGVPQDFTSPVVYTVTAQDEITTQDWTITVTVASPEIELPYVLTYQYPVELHSIDVYIEGGWIDDGGGIISRAGVCISTSVNPTISDRIIDGPIDVAGMYDLFVNNLSGATTYHVRYFATNETGTAYGADRSFTTPESSQIKSSGKLGKYNGKRAIIK